jgi:hypothetical protein
VAGLTGTITSDDFSFSEVLRTANSQSAGGQSPEDYLFTPGIYSVVFFIATQNSPPQVFSEVRVTVKGDVEVKAPAWSTWTHQ